MKKKLMTLIMVVLFSLPAGSVYAVEMYEAGLVEIHGFITQGYLVSDHNNFFSDTEGDGTFQFHEVGINFSSDVSERLRIGAQFFARDLGKMGDMEVTIDWAYADYSFYDWLNLRAGKAKAPHGLYNMERDVDMLRTFVLLPQSMYFEGWRDTINALDGAGFYGYIPAGFMGNFEYNMYTGVSSVPEDSGVSRLLTDQTPVLMDLKINYVDVEYSHFGQFQWDTVFGIDGLRIVTGAWSMEFDAHCEYNTGAVLFEFDKDNPATPIGGTPARASSVFHTDVFSRSASLEWVIGNTIFAAEYMRNSYELTLAPLSILSAPGVTEDKSDFDSDGWYASLTHRFLDWFEMGIYYSEYYAYTDDRDGKQHVQDFIDTNGAKGKPPGLEHNSWAKDLCLSTRFDITPNWVFKLEGHKINGSALMYSDDDNIDAAGEFMEFTEDWHMIAAKLAFSF